MTTISAKEARKSFSKILDSASDNSEPTVITRRGKVVAVVLPFEEYEAFEKVLDEIEDPFDIEASKQGLKEYYEGESITWDEAQKLLDA